MRTNPNSGPRIRIDLFYSTQCNRYFHLKIGVLSAPKTRSVHFRKLNDGWSQKKKQTETLNVTLHLWNCLELWIHLFIKTVSPAACSYTIHARTWYLTISHYTCRVNELLILITFKLYLTRTSQPHLSEISSLEVHVTCRHIPVGLKLWTANVTAFILYVSWRSNQWRALVLYNNIIYK
jgi:hypothetical protein